MIRFASGFCLLLAISTAHLHAQTTSIEWEAPIEVAPSEFGLVNLRMELDSDGHPVILHGKTGSSGGLYCTRWNGNGFDLPVPVTPETGLFINDGEGPRMAVSGDDFVVGYQISGQWAQGGRTVRSGDGGQTWATPVTIAPDATEDHFMPTPAFDGEGHPWVALKWGSNPTLEGILRWDETAESYADAENGGSSFPGGIACECCASMPFEHGGRLYNAVRINDDNTRDFHLARTNASGEWTESLDIDPTDWVINSCPASEAEVAVLGDGQLAFVFMSAAEGSSRTYWSTVDPETWTLTGSDRIDPGVEFNENNPSVSGHGDHSVGAWERSDGGYDILVGIGTNGVSGPTEWALSASVVTEGLSGHSRRPVVRLHDNVVHLVYQRPSEGLVHYRRGTVTTVTVPESDAPSWDCSIREDGWMIAGIGSPFEWSLYDAQGRLVDQGRSAGGMVSSHHTGPGILEIRTANKRRAFHVLR